MIDEVPAAIRPLHHLRREVVVLCLLVQIVEEISGVRRIAPVGVIFQDFSKAFPRLGRVLQSKEIAPHAVEAFLLIPRFLRKDPEQQAVGLLIEIHFGVQFRELHRVFEIVRRLFVRGAQGGQGVDIVLPREQALVS